MLASLRMGCWLLQVGGKPDFADPVVLSADRGGITMEHLCSQIHKSLVGDFSYALVWGRSSKHYPQRYGRMLPCSAPSEQQPGSMQGMHAGSLLHVSAVQEDAGGLWHPSAS